MNMIKFQYVGLFLGGLLTVTSCVDDKYDLSDIDTTTAIKLDGLVVPVKLNQITLDEVLDIDKESDGIIGEYTDKNGNKYYAIRKEGYFSADPVKINELRLTDFVNVPEISLPPCNGTIPPQSVDFSYLIKNVDSSLLYLSYFGLKEGEYMKIDLDIKPASAKVSNLELLIPDTYVATCNGVEYTNGVIPVEIENGSLKNPIYVTQMRFAPVLANVDNTLDINGKIGIKSANINSNGENLTFHFSMSSYTANVVSGAINYAVEAPSINSIELIDLPDFLTSGETNLILQNPQLYLDFSRMYGANYNTDLIISPVGNGVVQTVIDKISFQSAIVMAPDAANLGLPNLYSSPVLMNVPQLKYVLSGNGLPKTLNISLENTYLDGEITNIVLGTDPGIELSGSYTFFTPLAFAEGTKIIYNKKETDFFGDDMKDVEVRELQLSANITTNLPFAVTLTVYPLDKAGNKLDAASATVPANAKESLFDVHFTNTFNGLDGVEFTVTADDVSGDSLSPDQFLLLENIRAKVTGEYVTKL